MRLVTVTNGKEKNVIDQLSLENCKRYDYKDFLHKINDTKDFIAKDDYILLATREKSLLHVLEKQMLKAGIKRAQIIYISEWDVIKTDEMKKVEKIYGFHYYDRILIGMSHLENGIMLNRMKGNYIKIGIPSIDIFYISKIIQHSVNENKLVGCKSIIFELPYYMFNWDISKSSKMMERFQIAHYFGEYHHLGEDADGKIKLNKMLMLNDIMKNKIFQKGNNDNWPLSALVDAPKKKNIGVVLFNCIVSGIYRLPQQRKLCEKDYHIWSKWHIGTIKENQIEWRRMVKMLTQKYPEIEISVVIFPHNPYFRKLHKDKIIQMRDLFYKSVQYKNKIRIIDYFDFYLPFFCFIDECHLNEIGAYFFSYVLNRKLLKTN